MSRTIRSFAPLAPLALFTCCALAAVTAVAAPAAAETVAITGGKVYTVSGPPIENGTVVIRDGKIAAVGTGVAVPAGARVVDAAGKWVTPGLFDSAINVLYQGFSLNFHEGFSRETGGTVSRGDDCNCGIRLHQTPHFILARRLDNQGPPLAQKLH